MEDGLHGPHGHLVTKIVFNFEEGSALTQLLNTADGIVKVERIWIKNKNVLEVFVNLDYIQSCYGAHHHRTSSPQDQNTQLKQLMGQTVDLHLPI